ncbi:Gluconate 5-dehydrogenase [uncultured Roseburia sp.]|uniref:SDR family oxidoreductase n=1 Tax=Brotonthovivens ammoniilytica TaxID=2981725 RepID=A0ABT2TF96_9FIRM|nr:SDR family oxidoreductase [Brotonthovivens ammoniilytica]MCU6760865.1 SDR family oxidoreductase [Brotonthovivens ammoniilytica]SCI11624.1 Gluconate 5-dehydrogenase [uncultured Roseburia sp.]
MKNAFDLTGKKAVVVGGGGGIGSAIAKGLAFYGAEVVITGRNLETLENAAAAIKIETGKNVMCISADVTSEEAVKELYATAASMLGQVDILVNSQGYNQKFPINEMPLNVWNGMLNTNITSVMLTCRTFAQGMIERGWGRIINVSSIRAVRAVNQGMGNTCYSVTKAAVSMLTASLAAEWSKKGVTVNAVGPAITMTKTMENVFAQNPGVKDSLLANIPMGRLGEADDNITPVIFLASEESDFVTGQCIYTDGGSSVIV